MSTETDVVQWSLLIRDAVQVADDKCPMGVSRKDEYEPCDKPVIGLLKGEFEGEGVVEPVCVYHARQGRMVSLADIVATARDIQSRVD